MFGGHPGHHGGDPDPSGRRGRRRRGGGRLDARGRGDRRFRRPRHVAGEPLGLLVPFRRRFGRGRGRRRVGLDLRKHRLDGDRLSRLDQDLRDPARRRRGDLRVHLVRGDLEQGLVLGDQFPHLHEPLHDDPFHHAFPELGHHDVDEHRFTLLAFNTRRVSGSPR